MQAFQMLLFEKPAMGERICSEMTAAEASFYLITKMLLQQRHTGMDCRYPDYMEVRL